MSYSLSQSGTRNTLSPVVECVLQLLEEELCEPCFADADDADEDEYALDIVQWPGRAALKKLVDFCSISSKTEMVEATLCSGAFDGAGRRACLEGDCRTCGFKKLWSEGLRKQVTTLVFPVCPHVPPRAYKLHAINSRPTDDELGCGRL